MAKAKETVSRTLIVALVLSIVFSVVVSTAAVMLRPAQVKNQHLDMTMTSPNHKQESLW